MNLSVGDLLEGSGFTFAPTSRVQSELNSGLRDLGLRTLLFNVLQFRTDFGCSFPDLAS